MNVRHAEWHLHVTLEHLEGGDVRWSIQQPGDFWQGTSKTRDEALAIVRAAVRTVLNRRRLFAHMSGRKS